MAASAPTWYDGPVEGRWALVGALVWTGAIHHALAEDPEQAALGRLHRGIELYEGGDFRAARDEFAAAQALAPSRANPYRWLGMAEAKLGRCDAADGALDAFVRLVPEGDPRRAEALAARTACHDAERSPIPEAPARPQPAGHAAPARPPATPPVDRSRPTLRRAGLGLALAGAAVALAGGLGFGLAARDRADAIRGETVYDPSVGDALRTYQALAIASGVVGGALLVAGAGMWIAERLGRREPSLAAAPLLLPGGAGLALGGTL
jgi:tetratricopeptide (TPR) repeat protein